jgi:hypothetical protein
MYAAIPTSSEMMSSFMFLQFANAFAAKLQTES